MAAKIYTDKDADLGVLKGKTCAVIGFGSQGHAHALNLKDSGVKVIIGLYAKSQSREVAKEFGFEVMDTADAVKAADVIFIATPDTKIAGIFEKDIAPNLKKGQTLLFSHGFAVHFKTITPPDFVNVIMVAPKGPGHIVRRQFVEGKGVPSLIAIHQNPGKDAKKIALAWAKGIGGTRAGVFETLVEAGYQPEMAYFECLHELKLTVDLINESGISGMRFSISDTAEYGDLTTGPTIIDASVKKRMKTALKNIQSGKFAKGWIEESNAGGKNFNKLRKEGQGHAIEKVGARLRGLMPWIKKRATKGAQASYH
jgi:ketol-acid reductoisomerase